VDRRAVAAWVAVRALLASLALAATVPGAAIAAPTGIVFDMAPANPTNLTSATFQFHDTNGSSTFACLLDSAPVACHAGLPALVFSGLAEGNHTFSVQPQGGATAIPATVYQWTVDLTPPTTQITGQPPKLTTSKTSTFTFTSPDPTATFRCTLNGSTPAACTSPLTYTGLADATRSLLIQAVDPAGNVDTQAQPIVWTVDTTPPDTTIANPGNLTGKDVVEFSFSSSEAGSTFQCSFRTAAFVPCTSPYPVDVPGSGSQTFKVRAIDGAGNVDPTPATHQWTSDLTPPKRPRVLIFPAPSAHASAVALTAHASGVSPRPVPTRRPTLGLTFTAPLANLLGTSPWQESTHLHAQWSSDSTAHSYDVSVDEVPMDSTGMGFHGEELDYHIEHSHTTRTALNLNVPRGATVCVKVTASDKIGNVSRSRLTCTTVPISFTPRDVGPPPIKDAKAYHGYYIQLGAKGYEFVQDIGDQFYFSPTRVALIAERCHDCGVVEIDFNRFVGNPHNKNHQLATVNLNASDHSGDFHLIDVPLPAGRVERDGAGDIVIRAASGKPRISGIGVAN
jgi:hypothetical protein